MKYYDEAHSRYRRHSGNIFLIFLMLIAAIAFATLSIYSSSNNTKRSTKKMNKIVEDEYTEIYGDYYTQQNALIAFFVYQNGVNYDCKCKNSGNLEIFASYHFAEDYCTFDNYFDEHVPEEGYKLDLYKYLTATFKTLNDRFYTFYEGRYGNPLVSKIVNKTNAYYSGEESLKQAMATYHQYTNVNVSIVIVESDAIFEPNYLSFVMLLIPAIGCGLVMLLTISSYIKSNKGFKEYSGEDNVSDSNYQQTSSSSNQSSILDSGDDEDDEDPFAEFDTGKDPFDEYYSKHNQNK